MSRSSTACKQDMVRADERALEIKQSAERQEETIRDARRAVDALRALAAEVDVQRATAESDLTHLAQQAMDTVNATPRRHSRRGRADGGRGPGAARRAGHPRR